MSETILTPRAATIPAASPHPGGPATETRRPLVTIGGQPVWSSAARPPARVGATLPAAEKVAIKQLSVVERLRATAAQRNCRGRPLPMSLLRMSQNRLLVGTLLLIAAIVLLTIVLGIRLGKHF